MMGALSYTLAGTDALKLIAELKPGEPANDELLLRRLAPFLLAGLTRRSPTSTRRSRARARPARDWMKPRMLTLLWILGVRRADRARLSQRRGIVWAATSRRARAAGRSLLPAALVLVLALAS